MDPHARLTEIDQTLEAIRNGWPFLLTVLKAREGVLTEQLVNQDNEQTRGRIKALRELMELPESLTQERDGISAGLADAPAL